MRIRLTMLAVLYAAFILPLSAAPPIRTAGRWEITIRTISASFDAPPTVTEFCLSREEAEHEPAPPRPKKNDECQITGALHGNSLKYTSTCGRRHASSNAEFTYHGDGYEGVVTGTIDGREFRQIITAKRIGDCEDDE